MAAGVGFHGMVFFAASSGEGVVAELGYVLQYTDHNVNKSEVGGPTGSHTDSASSFVSATSIITRILLEGQMDEMRLLLANLRVVPPVVSIQGQHLLATVSMAHSMVADIARF